MSSVVYDAPVDVSSVVCDAPVDVSSVVCDAPVALSRVVCDAPARAFLKRIKGHSGYNGCDKCIQPGLYNLKMTFPEVDAPIRTNVAFNEMEDAEHHKGPNPFHTMKVLKSGFHRK